MAARARLRRCTDESSSPSVTASLPSGAPTGAGKDFAPEGCLELDLEDVQPGAARSAHPRVVLADNEDLVVLWYQRAVGRDGRRLDTPVLGLCHVRDGRLARAQMFYFDTAGVVRFPRRWKPRAGP